MAVAGTKKRKKKKKANLPLIITLAIFGVLVAGVLIAYFVGRSYYSDRFLPNTFINNVNVSGMTLEEIKEAIKKRDEMDKN